MYFSFVFFILTLFIFDKSRANVTKECETKGIVLSNLDLAVHLINTAKEGYPVCPSTPLPLDCEDVLRSGQNKSGVYKTCPKSRIITACPLELYCDMDTDGRGWTVIQRRGNFLRPKDFFFQGWQAYKEGFGSIEKDFWLGNDNIFAVSNQKLYSVRFDLQDVEGSRRYALYDTFWIDDENHQYTLHIEGYSGDAGESMLGTHNNQKFSTKDRKNDKEPEGSCAEKYKGGWWYNRCHSANLNGLYHRGKHDSYADGVNWDAWKGLHESLEATEIKIRSKDFMKTL